MDTRGLRHLKAYLGDDSAKKARAKRAVDVVPVLAARRSASSATASRSDKGLANTTASPPLSPSVMEYLESRLSAGATYKLSRTQMLLVEALAAPKGVKSGSQASTTAPLSVTRGRASILSEMVDTVALSALELAARTASAQSASLSVNASLPTPPFEMSSLFVLTEDAAKVAEVAQQLEGRYGLTVLRLDDSEAPRYPTFPSPKGGGSKTSKSAAARAKKAKAVAMSTEASAASTAASVVVVVASPAGFLAVNRRSAIWKLIGGFAVLLCLPATQSGSLLSVLAGSEPTSSATPQALNAQRWACLGHVSNIAVMAQEQAWLSAPAVDLLTTLSVTGGDLVSAAADAAAGAEDGDQSVSAAANVVASSRRPVTVHYTVAEGTQRFQFLFSLLKALVPHRGLVVHVATRECATFLYDTLYSFLDELPSYVQIFSDYEGASSFTSMHTSADRQRMCAVFDTVVQAGGQGGKTAAVLISCHGLVPRKGCVFLQYDIIPDLVNYPQFVAEVLTPAAALSASSTAAAAGGKAGTLDVHREKTTRQRKRSVSPPPVADFTGSTAADTPTQKGAAAAEKTSSTTAATPVNYTHILLLLRPNEVRGALGRLRNDAAVRYRLDYHELPNKTGGRYLFIGEKLKSLNKKLFAIQNAAYGAYKATMRVYSTIGPRDVYDETKVALEKVAEEFGYTELPLLDLRLKDTVFRPKEDYFRAARQKQEAERRVYKRFAQDNIIGEEPEPHVADAE
ncbi:hypothetical protein ABB37_06017 [Leptomonas pyrrhocoris]|uniref:Uncharacterized protein n=1 Tax=Leptomonas pyrrhocoris TaxID=157538 RepID=A0A0M9FZ52_LEPPY|nr:hypothetical protein ABB37_06017 [Leptomonas pyrrhocoris]KPA78953.1 hypothetical protein ABB37_06017 [Leptomonas pyrrhocoris]|eukprot:XP_015657392.1 hypothetical protein ABB37_06017 [Leptomonas pyrrhocoris]